MNQSERVNLNNLGYTYSESLSEFNRLGVNESKGHLKMSDKKEKVLLGQLTKRYDKNKNIYFIGNFGMSTMTIFPHKTKPDVFNIFVSTKEFKKPEQSNENEFFPPNDFNNSDDIF